MNVYDIDIVTDSDEGRTVNVWTLNANNMAEALLDAFEKNKNSLKGVTEGAVMVTITKQLSKQAEVANFEARAKVEQMSPEMVRLMTTGFFLNFILSPFSFLLTHTYGVRRRQRSTEYRAYSAAP